MAKNQLIPASGAAITFDYVLERVQPLAPVVEEWSRPGLDGSGARVIGQRAPETTIRVVKFVADEAAAAALEASVRALVGTYIGINTEVASVTYTNVRVLAAGPVSGTYSAVTVIQGTVPNNKRVEMAVTVRQC